MNSTVGHDMSLRDFVDSVWFKGLARGAMVMAPLIVGYAGWTLTDINAKLDTRTIALDNRLDTTETALSTVNGTLALRANDNETFQRDVARQFAEQGRSLDALKAQGEETKTTLATVQGILEEMRRRDQAVLLR